MCGDTFDSKFKVRWPLRAYTSRKWLITHLIEHSSGIIRVRDQFCLMRFRGLILPVSNCMKIKRVKAVQLQNFFPCQKYIYSCKFFEKHNSEKVILSNFLFIFKGKCREWQCDNSEKNRTQEHPSKHARLPFSSSTVKVMANEQSLEWVVSGSHACTHPIVREVKILDRKYFRTR